MATLPANHPDAAGRRAQSARYGRCIPGWQGESVTVGWLPTCDGAWCARHVEGGVWQHTPECDRRNRDGEYQTYATRVDRSRTGGRGRPSGRDERRIAAAEWTRDGGNDPRPWDGGFDREIADRQAAARRAAQQWGGA